MSAAVTDWFSGEQQPWEPGLYERQWDSGGTRWTWWNGRHWCVSSSVRELACSYTDVPSGRQKQPWRGLAADPNPRATALSEQIAAGIKKLAASSTFGRFGGGRFAERTVEHFSDGIHSIGYIDPRKP